MPAFDLREVVTIVDKMDGTPDNPWHTTDGASGSAANDTTPEGIRTRIQSNLSKYQFVVELLCKATTPLDPAPVIRWMQELPDNDPTFLWVNDLLAHLDQSLEYAYTADENLRNQTNQTQAHQAVAAAQESQIQELRGQLAAARLVAPAAPSAPHTFQARQTSRNPDALKGEKTNALVRQEEYNAWKLGLQICWEQDSAFFTTERKKLLHLCSLLEGTARQEREVDIKAILDSTSPITTAAAMLAKLDTIYISVNMYRDAVQKYNKLQMSDKQSFSSFCSTLEKLAATAKKSDEDIVQAMKDKACLKLRKVLKHDASLLLDDDVAGWRQRFQIWDQNVREYDIREGNGAANASSSAAAHSGRPAQTPALSSPAAGDPMDLDAFRALSKEQQRNEARRLGLCYFCKETGHLVWECAKKKQADARKAAAGGTVAPRGGYSGYNHNGRGGGAQASARGGYNSFGRGNFGGRGGSYSGYQQPRLHAAQGYVEEESLAPSDSASNTLANNLTPATPSFTGYNQGNE